MKAIIWTRYGPPDVLQLQEVEKPTPKDDEVLVKVHAATVTTGDCELRRLQLPVLFRIPMRIYAGFSRPKRIRILGQELAGEIEALGREANRFKKGDPIFAPTFFRFGAYAQYACVPERYLVPKPASLTYEEAATIPTGGMNGVHFLKVANVQPGEKLLINGAGGSIGTYAIQIAKCLGADVTAVDRAEKLDMLRAMGADHVIDYTREDFTRSGGRYDIVIDVIGKSSFSGSLRALKPGGRYILGNASLAGLIRSRWTSIVSQKNAIVAVASYKAEDYTFIQKLIEAGKIKPVIDRLYPLEKTAEAHRYVDGGQKKGNVVITVDR